MAKSFKKRTVRRATATATGKKKSSKEVSFRKLNDEIAAWHEQDPTIRTGADW
jgi:hypothetical protein